MSDGAGSRRGEDTGQLRRALSESADGVVADVDGLVALSDRERQLAGALASAMVARLPGLIGGRPDNLRLADLETWRKHEIDPWRRKLTGEDDRNGRLGRIDQAIANTRDEIIAGDAAVRRAVNAAVTSLRKDVGTPEERRNERAAAALVNGFRRRTKAAVAAAVGLVLGGGGLAVWRIHSDSVASAARTADRLDQLEHEVDRLYQFHGAAAPPRSP